MVKELPIKWVLGRLQLLQDIVVSLCLYRLHYLRLLSFLQFYILLTNFVIMGLVPSGIMIVFNVLVVRAVNEANKRRAR